MNELLNKQIELAPVINGIEGISDKWIALKKFPIITKYDRDEFTKFVRDAIKRVYFETGFVKQLDAPTLDATTSIVVADFLRDFPKLTPAEIAEAFRMGARKEFGEYFGISVVTLLTWIKSFINIEQRKASILKYYELKQKKNAQKHENSIEAIEKQIIRDMISEMQKHGFVEDFGNGRYNYLVKIGEIKVDSFSENMDDAFEWAEHLISTEISEAKMSRNTSKIRELTEELEKMRENNTSSRAVKLAHKITVNKWITNYIKNGNK
jgi:polyhydroxyalkanoate synthesis regulator phasin